FLEDVKLGTVKSYNNRRLGGFGGHGLERFVVERENIKKMQRLTYGEGDDQDEDDEEEQDQALGPEHDRQARPISGEQPSSGSTLRASSSAISALKAAQEAASKFNASSSSMSTTTGAANTPGASKNAESALPANPAPRQFTNVIDQINAELGYSSSSSTANRSSVLQNDDLRAAEFFAEVEINDYPQKVRWKVTNREALSQISESTGVAITVKGIHMPSSSSSGGGSGGKPSAHSSFFSSKHAYLNERKLYLRIEGNSEFSVESAKSQIKSILSDAALQSGQLAIDYRF
ncbi:Pre-mRNA-processing ATP-dependent RNA helicase prp5, partial [Zancudomyces culisetae]